MVTYLLSAGYSSLQVGIARTVGVVFEVLATWVAPWLMGRIGAIRAGLWMSSWQVTMLAAGVSVFWMFDMNSNSLIAASGLVGGTVLSRLGLRGFDLCVQLIVQEVWIYESPMYESPMPCIIANEVVIIIRKSKPRTAASSLPLRLPGKAPLSFSPIRPPLSFLALSSSNGRRSSQPSLLRQLAVLMQRLFTCAEAICCISRLSHASCGPRRGNRVTEKVALSKSQLDRRCREM